MKTIFFPTQYKKALLDGTKNTTIRVGNEIGKYKTGKTHFVKSYAGKDWKVKIKITEVTSTAISKLSKYKIPKRSIDSIVKKYKLFPSSRVEIIRFEIFE